MKRVLCSGVLIVLLALTAGAQTPYRGYTYNQWGEAVRSPEGYLPDDFYNGKKLGLDSPFDNPQDFYYDAANKRLYIADTGNSRIVVLDDKFGFVGEIAALTNGEESDSFSEPSGVFADGKGALYVADTGNARVVKCDGEGRILRLYGEPESAALESDYSYEPVKVIADKDGQIYVQSKNIYQGLVCFNAAGAFTRFFGSSRVELTSELLYQQFLRLFMTKEQRGKVLAFVPIEYANMYIDPQGFIYAVVSKSDNSLDEIKKLNGKGDNVLRVNPYGDSAEYQRNNYGDNPVYYTKEGKPIDTSFVDVHADERGCVTALDGTRGRIFMYDDDSNLMFVFGTMGDQVGAFTRPVALERMGDDVLVLDSEEGGFTVFKQTGFGETVCRANRLYNDGKYLEALEPWRQVLRENSNYNLAYNGLGKAYYQMEDYRQAMRYFKLGYDKVGYSRAQQEYFTLWGRRYFPLILLAAALFVLLPFVLPAVLAARRKRRGRG